MDLPALLRQVSLWTVARHPGDDRNRETPCAQGRLQGRFCNMPILATWIRQVDEAPFARWFAEQPDLDERNARLDSTDGSLDDPLPPGTAGLLLTGGPDIGAEMLNQPVPDPSIIEEPEAARDRWEFAALHVALERRLPILAICKGVQVLNVALGGTLHLDIPGHNLPEWRDGNLQTVRYTADAPTPRFEVVNSSHHQALDELGDGLVIEAWSTGDEIIEQVRLRDYPYCVGVQFHPERDALYAPLFHDFFGRLAAGSPRANP